MITKTKSFQTSDGQIFGSIPEAQEHELSIIVREIDLGAKDHAEPIIASVAKHLVANGERVADILTTKGSSKPKARAVNGGTKKRTPKPQVAPKPEGAA